MVELRESLERLSSGIADCRMCDQRSINVQHAGLMRRGTGCDVMVVGVQPGSTEIKTGEAFSGLAGRRLIAWLVRAQLGRDRSEVLDRAYLTSICKCKVQYIRDVASAARNCLPFLQTQISVIRPRLLITLGLDPPKFLFGYTGRFDDIACRFLMEDDLYSGLFPNLPQGTKILPLPHPSPLSRWTNSSGHQELLGTALLSIAGELP